MPPLRASAAGRISAPPHRRGLLESPIVLVVLAVMAVVPSLALAALYWRHALGVPDWLSMSAVLADAKSAPPQPLPEAVAASVMSSETVMTKRDLERPAVALNLAAEVLAEAGKNVPFPIALDGTERLPLRSIVTVGGLPEGARLSAGRPYGNTEWSLRPDEIGGLGLNLPKEASGSHVVAVALIAGDGTALASGTTRLEIAPDPKAALILRPADVHRIEELLARGHKMIEVGYLAGARGYFRRAAEAGSAEAALALGASYDPSFIAEIGAQGIPPDRDEARLWYERAKMLGSTLADARIAALEQAPAMQQGDGVLEPVAQPSAPGPADDSEWVEVSGSVHMRAEPMPQAKTLKIAERGMRFKATGRKGGWVQVTDPKTAEVGWIYSRYVAVVDTP